MNATSGSEPKLRSGGAAWCHLDAERPAARFTAVIGSFVLLALFLLSIDRHVSPHRGDDTSGSFIAEAERTQVFLVIVDALSPEVVDSGQLRFLQPLVERGFHADVEPCADRLTIPCLREAFTGQASFGLFGAFDNLVAAERIDSSNLFRDLREAGLRSAGIANGELDQFAGWLDRYDRYPEDEIAATVSALHEGYDLVVYHYVWFDEATHRISRDSNAYRAALVTLSNVVGAILEELPPDYELVVIGDHGHDEDGRHIQGLDVPTSFHSSGSLWGSRRLSERIPITSYRLLLGAKLGLLPPAQYEGADLRYLLPDGSALATAAEGIRFTRRAPAAGLPLLPALLAALLPCALLWAAPVGRRRAFAGALAAGAAALAAGVLYPEMVAFLHYNLTVPNFTAWLPWLVLVTAVAGGWLRAADRVGLALLSLFWIAYPQTLYPYGFYLRAVPMVAATTIGFLLLRGQREAKSRKNLASDLLVLLALLGVVQLIAPVSVLHFKIQRFVGLLYVPKLIYLGFPLVWALLAAAMAPRWTPARPAVSKIAWGLLAGVGATVSALTDLPPGIVVLLTATAGCGFWLRSPATLFLAAAWLLPQLVELIPAYGVGLSAALALLIVWSTTYRPTARAADRWIVAGLLAALAYFATAYVSGLRPNGLDFKFAIEWLPTGTAQRLWFVVGAALLVKVLLPAALIFFGASRLSRRPLRAPIQYLIGVRLAASMLFTVGFLSSVDELPRLRLLEICSDMIVWWFLLAVVSLVPWPAATASEEAS